MISRSNLEKIAITLLLGALSAAVGAYWDVQNLKAHVQQTTTVAKKAASDSAVNRQLLCLVAIRVSKPQDRATVEKICVR